MGKAQRTNPRSTKVALLFLRAQETGHYETEHLWNEELGRADIGLRTSDVRPKTPDFTQILPLNLLRSSV